MFPSCLRSRLSHGLVELAILRYELEQMHVDPPRIRFGAEWILTPMLPGWSTWPPTWPQITRPGVNFASRPTSPTCCAPALLSTNAVILPGVVPL